MRGRRGVWKWLSWRAGWTRKGYYVVAADTSRGKPRLGTDFTVLVLRTRSESLPACQVGRQPHVRCHPSSKMASALLHLLHAGRPCLQVHLKMAAALLHLLHVGSRLPTGTVLLPPYAICLGHRGMPCFRWWKHENHPKRNGCRHSHAAC